MLKQLTTANVSKIKKSVNSENGIIFVWIGVFFEIKKYYQTSQKLAQRCVNIKPQVSIVWYGTFI